MIMYKNKKENGITLIALIITIIILVILAAVSIRAAYNSGIIDYSINGTRRYMEEEKKEQSTLSETESHLKSLLEKISNLEQSNVEAHDWVRDGDALICTCPHCVEKNGEYGTELYIGDILDYDYQEAGGTGTTSITAEKSGIAQAKLDNKDLADYYGNSQELSIIGEDTYWAVLGAEDRDNNGTNETLLLTTLTPTEGTLVLYGAIAYNNWVAEANRMAVELYGRDARAMTFEDVCNCLQYHDVPCVMIDADGCIDPIYETNVTVYDFYDDDIDIIGTYYPDPNSQTGYSLDNTTGTTILGSMVLNGRYISADGYSSLNGNNSMTNDEKALIFPSNNLVFDNYYWLASTGIYPDLAPYHEYTIRFCVGSVGSEGAHNINAVFSSSGQFWGGYELSFRAVVSLTSNIPDLLD